MKMSRDIGRPRYDQKLRPLGRREVTLVWEEGSSSVKAMASLIATGRVFRPLADATLFTAAQLINNGRAVAWGDEVDMCADALWLEAHPQDAPRADALWLEAHPQDAPRAAQPHAAE